LRDGGGNRREARFYRARRKRPRTKNNDDDDEDSRMTGAEFRFALPGTSALQRLIQCASISF
jgi:hypothetical protein